MKKTAFWACALLLSACGQSQVEAPQTVPSSEITPLKPEMTETEIARSFFVSDTVKKDFTTLIGTTGGFYSHLPTMFAAADNDQLLGVFELDDSTRIIPFFIDRDMEIEIFTKWRKASDSTYAYLGRLKPDMPSKYAFWTIKELIETPSGMFFIGETTGGEGGDIWQTIWTARYNGTDLLDRTDQFHTGYLDGEENRKYLTYERKGRTLSIFETTDSLVFRPDTALHVLLNKALVKTV